MSNLLEGFEKNKFFQNYIKEIEKKKDSISISGLSNMGKIHFLANTIVNTKNPILLITYNEIQAKQIVKNMKTFLPEDTIAFFPTREILTYDYIAESQDLPYERIEVLKNIKNNKYRIIVTTIEALMQKMVSPEALYTNIVEFKVGEEPSIIENKEIKEKVKEKEKVKIDFEETKRKLIHLGYKRTDLIEGKGQFTVKGGIIDVAEDNKKGIRIEFWGDEVDSIREFDILSQRSTKTLETYELLPAHEFILEDELENICE